MSNIPRDANQRPVLSGILNTDGVTITPVKADPTTHIINTSDDTTGSDNGNNGGIAMLDENSVAVGTAVSSSDGVSIVELYVDASGNLLINSN